MRRFSLVACLLLSTVAWASDSSSSQFLDKTLVTVPKAVGDYRLKSMEYDQAAFSVGVSTNWRTANAPDTLAVSMYVYPMGRAPEADVVAREIQGVEDGVREAVKQNIYSDLEVGERKPFLVVARESSILDDAGKKLKQTAAFDPTPKPEFKLTPAKDADPVVALLAENAPSPNNHGQRQSFRFKHDGAPMRSLGYVFYRNLFAIKVRVSVPESDMDQAAFEAVADNTARYLVPQVDVKNFGSCGTIEVPSADKKADKDTGSQLMMQAMIGGMARIKAENCANDEGKKPDIAPADSERKVIVYPAGTWKSS